MGQKEQETWIVLGALEVVLKDVLQNFHDQLEEDRSRLICQKTMDSLEESKWVLV